MEEYRKKMKEIHATYKDSRFCRGEEPEQWLIIKHLKEDDVVLEIGGSCGRASCMINSLLKNKTNQVTIEANPGEARALKKNRDINGFKFHIEPNVLSTKPLYSYKWRTYPNPRKNAVKVNNMTYEQLLKKYKLNFNVIIADCEGAIVPILKQFPNMLDNIRLFQTEHDFESVGEEGFKFFKETMEKKGFKMTDKFMKTDEGGPGMIWVDGLRSDPIFVSVWTK